MQSIYPRVFLVMIEREQVFLPLARQYYSG